MIIIQQGDQYLLPFKIKKDGSYITPATATDVRVQLGDTLRTYSKSELSFDSSTNEWYYPMTQAESKKYLNTTVQFQVGIKQTNNIYYSPAQTVVVGESIIKETW